MHIFISFEDEDIINIMHLYLCIIELDRLITVLSRFYHSIMKD
jgi:hypothetical protein